ncbi:MAG: nucleoside deaminase [Candidatus Obscuribacterales bacterium]|nr:nucleoside deaminase [Candidatus Obscuribacterales bacterium]
MDQFMQAAIEQAKIGLAQGGIPIGSVLVRNGEIIGRGHNRRLQNNDPTAHAEIECLRNAGKQKHYRDTVLYSTLMPCAMCAGASVQFAIPKIIAGENRTFKSAMESMQQNGLTVVDLNLEECFQILQDFINKHPEAWLGDIGEL